MGDCLMGSSSPHESPPVLCKQRPHMVSVVLNRPHRLNSLDEEMVRMIREGMEEALREDRIQFVLFYGAGERGFCAGGDVKAMAQAVRDGILGEALRFLEEEYALDSLIHRFPKPVLVIADGITMGGGLGISAGADLVLATERTRMAMPETRIGFFPDVGATGWMFRKCPKGYPEYLGLTGYEIRGKESVRLGLATDLVLRKRVPELIHCLENDTTLPYSQHKVEAVERIRSRLSSFFEATIHVNPRMDEWVSAHFAGTTSVPDIVASLSHCTSEKDLCGDVFESLAERSPTALVLTLRLLRHNETLPMDEVFETDLKAARFILQHPDFLEGVRARLVDKDDRPHWQPARIEDVKLDWDA